MIGWLALACAILFNPTGNFFIKHSSLTTEVKSPLSYLNTWFVLGIAVFGVNVFFYSRALKDIPLVIVYRTLIGISLSLVAIFGSFSSRSGSACRMPPGFSLIILGANHAGF
jgi:multidrug transporter EmrE-like cation transporter